VLYWYNSTNTDSEGADRRACSEAQALVQQGADLNARDPGDGMTALHKAVFAGDGACGLASPQLQQRCNRAATELQQGMWPRCSAADTLEA
jgi:ankyrin repeat protein